MQNLTSDGHTWKKFNAPMERVLKRAEVIRIYVPELYEKVMLPEFLKYQERGIIK